MALPTVAGAVKYAGGAIASGAGMGLQAVLGTAFAPLAAAFGQIGKVMDGIERASQRSLKSTESLRSNTESVRENSDLSIDILSQILEVQKAQYAFMVSSATKAARTRAQNELDRIELERENGPLPPLSDDAAPPQGGRRGGLFGKIFGGIGKIFAPMLGFFRPILRLARFVPMFAKLSGIGTILYGLFEFFDGFMEKWDPEKQNFGEAGVEGMRKMVQGIIGMPVKLLQGAAAWVLKKLGFPETAEELESFDVTAYIDGIFQRDGKNVTMGNLLTRMLFAPLDLMQGAVNWVLKQLGFEVKDDGVSIGDKVYDAIPSMDNLKKMFADFTAWVYTSPEKNDGKYRIFGMNLPTWATIKATFEEGYQSSVDWVSEVGKMISSNIQALGDWIYTPGEITESGESLRGPKIFGIEIPTWGALKKAFSERLSTVVDYVTDIPNMVGRFFNNAIGQIGEFIYREADGKTFLFGFELPTWETIKKEVNSLVDDALDIGKQIAKSISDLINKITGWISRQIEEITNAVKDTRLGRLIWGDEEALPSTPEQEAAAAVAKPAEERTPAEQAMVDEETLRERMKKALLSYANKSGKARLAMNLSKDGPAASMENMAERIFQDPQALAALKKEGIEVAKDSDQYDKLFQMGRATSAGQYVVINNVTNNDNKTVGTGGGNGGGGGLGGSRTPVSPSGFSGAP